MLAPGLRVSWLDLVDVAGLRAPWTVHHLELDGPASVALDESVTLGVVEPLDLACDAHRSCSYVLGRQRAAASLNQLRQPLPKQKKRPRCAAFPFRRQARPASAR